MKTESSERYHDDKAKRASLAGGQSGFERKEMRIAFLYLTKSISSDFEKNIKFYLRLPKYECYFSASFFASPAIGRN